jgi:hypothetical protein
MTAPRKGQFILTGYEPASTALGRARAEAKTHDQFLAGLSLDPFQRHVPNLAVTESVVRAKVTLTIEGASTLEIAIHDPTWFIEESGVIDPDQDGRMQAVDIELDGLRWRIVKAARRDPDTLEMTFEPLEVAALRLQTKRRVWSRNEFTRAEAIQSMVAEVKVPQIMFDSPERGRKQSTQSVDFPDATPAAGATGFDRGVKLKVKGNVADSGQMREMATVMTVCDQQSASPRARLAATVAAIGESEFKAIMNRSGSPYGGVFQGNVRDGTWRLSDTAGMARSFLKGGKGFQGGGAIALAREHPDWSVGHIAYVVEGSRANFGSDAAAEDHYQQHHDEAAKIVAAWNRANPEDSTGVLVVKSYQFTRGLPGQKESSWTAMQRLAGEVNWRCFAVGGVITFASDDYLISGRADIVIDGPKHPGLLAAPTYDWDHGHVAGEVELSLNADLYAVTPGNAVSMQHFGPVSGRWLVHTVEQDLFDAAQTIVTLVKPMPEGKEPAPEVSIKQVDRNGNSTSGGDVQAGEGAQAALAWARSKLGHYKEEFGNNRGTELDKLQQSGVPGAMLGAPWCATFATTAVSYGGVTRDCRTASVDSIRQWGTEGSHGYEKGFRATPEPGDLCCHGGEHVILVEKVHRYNKTVDCIQGNGSAGKVDRRTVGWDYGVFVRPKYAT